MSSVKKKKASVSEYETSEKKRKENWQRRKGVYVPMFKKSLLHSLQTFQITFLLFSVLQVYQ